MDTAEAFQIVLDFIRANAPRANEANRQINDAADILEDIAVNEYGDD